MSHSNFTAIDGQMMELRPNTHATANQSAPSPTYDSVFVQLKFTAEAGAVDLKGKLPYYDLGTDKPGSVAINFKVEYAAFDAQSGTISLQLTTNKTIAAELSAGLTKVLKGGAKAQLSVELTAANEKQTVDQANKGTIIQYFDPAGAKFTMDETATRDFQTMVAQQCGDVFTRSAGQNDTTLTDTIYLSGKWEKETPINTWSGNSTEKVVVGVVAAG